MNAQQSENTKTICRYPICDLNKLGFVKQIALMILLHKIHSQDIDLVGKSARSISSSRSSPDNRDEKILTYY